MLFWELFKVLSWFEGAILREKEEQVLKVSFFFQQLLLEAFLNIAGPKMFSYIHQWMILDTHFFKICLSEMLTHYES